nr:actin filament-associated protein 1-like 2 isoform X6 [Anas platyrhynchos]
MARHGDLDRLLCDLRSFLLILDRESLSAEARAKKKSVAELLRRLQSPQSEDAEYMSMRCLSPSSGPPQGRDNSGTRTQDARGGRACEHRPGSTQSPHGGSTSPSTSPSPPPDDSYEDTEPFGPGGRGGSGGADTDSSHYESYGEDEDAAPLPDRAQDRAHYLRRPPAGGPPLPNEPPGRPEAQLCGFLWRKRWLGRWAKQLFIVREHALLGFRRAADPQPVLELELRGCRVASKGTGSKKLPRALKVTGPAGEALVIGFPSRQQAEDWRKVIEEVSSNSPSGLAPHSPPASPPSRLSRALRLGSKEEEEQEEASQNPREDPKGAAAELGRSRARAAPETRVQHLQQLRALAGSAGSQQGFLPSPAHPDAAREERGSGMVWISSSGGGERSPSWRRRWGQMERARRGKSRMKAGSEMNLLAIGKSLRGHIAATASSAASEGSFLSPLLRRTASARSALKCSPSAGVVEKGKVLQQRKEWEMKAAK